MTGYDPGSVVLVRIPFTDLRSLKKRPALVVSPPEYSARFGDLFLLALTSKPQTEPELLVEGVATGRALDAHLVQADCFLPGIFRHRTPARSHFRCRPPESGECSCDAYRSRVSHLIDSDEPVTWKRVAVFDFLNAGEFSCRHP